VAQVVAAVATAHTPLLILPPEQWLDYAARDPLNPELVFPPDGLARGYDEALAGHVSAEIRDQPRDLEHFRRQSANCQEALDACAATLREARPDVVLIISDDQDEWFYESNMPMYAVYWGDSVPLIPRPKPTAGTALQREMDQRVFDGYASTRRDVPVDAAFGRHVVEHLVEHDFDISQMTYVDASYGGRITRRTPTPSGAELGLVRETAYREVGIPHGYGFVLERLLDHDVPILPFCQNTCYPPNAVTPRRCYAIGTALADAIAGWDDDVRVAVVASGGLSHFVVDEELDRMVLAALQKHDVELLQTLPRERLRSATSETLNWVTLAAITESVGMEMELLAYEPVYRTEAGTGAGLAMARWR
jgi:3-O-methylgallate 3,4-dioxygenase